MAKMFASWVHGQAAAAEWQPEEFRIWGPGAYFRIAKGSDLWVHLAVPTPVLIEDRRATLHAMHYLYTTSDQGSILASVHVRDGDGRFFGRDVSGFGVHNQGLDADNGIEINWDGIQWGIGLSLKFANLDGAGVFALTAAGGDFYHDI